MITGDCVLSYRVCYMITGDCVLSYRVWYMITGDCVLSYRVCYMITGDCVLSEPTEWSPCSCETNSTRTRSRTIIRPPTTHGQKCMSLTQTQPCRCHTYRLDIGRWKSCIPLNKQSCGEGEL